MKFVFEAVMLSISERQSKDGKAYYSINLDQDGDIVKLDCTPEVARAVGNQKYKACQFTGEYTKSEYGNQVFTRFGVIDAKVKG